MLKHIPAILTPELLKVLMEMGHGDEIVIADGNFPRCGNCTAADPSGRSRRAGDSGRGDAFFPLDSYTEKPVGLMEVVAGDPGRSCNLGHLP